MWRGWLLCNTDAYICIYMTEQITKDMCRRGQRPPLACVVRVARSCNPALLLSDGVLMLLQLVARQRLRLPASAILQR